MKMKEIEKTTTYTRVCQAKINTYVQLVNYSQVFWTFSVDQLCKYRPNFAYISSSFLSSSPFP